MKIDGLRWSWILASMACAACTVQADRHPSSSDGASAYGADPPAQPPAEAAPPASTPAASPSTPPALAPLVQASARWSIDRGGTGAARVGDAVAVLGLGDLFTLDASGSVIADQLVADHDALVATFEALPVDGALAGVAIHAGSVAIVDPGNTVVSSAPSCLATSWSVPVGGSAVRFSPSGDVYVAGVDASFQRSLTKLAAADGAVLWRIAFDDLAADSNLRIRTGAFDAMDLDAAGNVYVTGFVEHGDIRSGEPYVFTSTVVKVAPDGTLVWRVDRDLERARAIVVSGDAITVAARSAGQGAVDDLDVEQYAMDGALRWSFAPPLQGEIARRLTGDPIVAAFGGSVFVAMAVSEGGLGALPTLTMAFGADGATRWYAYATSTPRAVVAMASGVYVVRDDGVTAYDVP